MTSLATLLLQLNSAKMPTATTVFSVFAGIVAVLSVYVYFFGIPPAVKRELEEKALKTMGENKASYLVKGMPATACGSCAVG